MKAIYLRKFLPKLKKEVWVDWEEYKEFIDKINYLFGGGESKDTKNAISPAYTNPKVIESVFSK